MDARARVVRALTELPDERVAEIESYVEFIAARERRRQAGERLLGIARELHAAGLEPMTEDEIVAECRAVRRQMSAERRALDALAS